MSRSVFRARVRHLRSRQNSIPMTIRGVSTHKFRNNFNVFLGLLDKFLEVPASCEEIDNVGERRSCYISHIEEYGIRVNSSMTRELSEEMLRQILMAIQGVSNRLYEILQQCPVEDENANAKLTPQEIFQRVFMGEEELRLNYDTSKDYANVDSSIKGLHILTLAQSTFEGKQGLYSDQIISEIITHELGHVFHNRLRSVVGDNYKFSSSNVKYQRVGSTLVVTFHEITIGNETFKDLKITAQGNTSLVLLDYVASTGGYWAGDVGFETGVSRTIGKYTRSDALDSRKHVVPLTNLVYGNTVGVPQGCDGINCEEEHLVDTRGNCILDGNRNCVPKSRALTESNDQFVYVRNPSVYIPGEFVNITMQSFFSNELGRTTESSAPKEGFADSFKFYITEDPTELPTTEFRIQFLDENFCKWLHNLIYGR